MDTIQFPVASGAWRLCAIGTAIGVPRMLTVTAFFQPFASSQSGVSGFGRISPPRFQPYQSTTTMRMTLHYEKRDT